MDIATNETLIQASLISIKNAQAQFVAASGRYGSLRELVDDGLLAIAYLTPMDMNGYQITMDHGPDFFRVHADPRTPGVTGNRSFYVDGSGAVHVEEDGRANAASPLI